MKDIRKYEEVKGEADKHQLKNENSHSSSFSNERRSSMEPIPLIEDWDNLKQESNLKIIQGFFIKGIQQYFQDKLVKNVSLNIEKNKVVYVQLYSIIITLISWQKRRYVFIHIK